MEPQLCTARKKAPRNCWLFRYCKLGHASLVLHHLGRHGESVAALRMPTLVPHGDEDALVPFASGEEIAATIPGSRLVRIEGAGHNFLVAAPEKSKTAVLEFLREVDRNAARAGTSFANG